MRTFTIKNTVTIGLRFYPPDKDIGSWHFRLGGGEAGRAETLIPADKELSAYLTRVDGDLCAGSKGEPQQSFQGYTPEELSAARAEVYDGWTVDELFLAEDHLCHAGKHHPKGGPCLVHIAVPTATGQLELEAGSYTEVLEGGRIKRQYHDIDSAAGVTPLHVGEGPRGTYEHLFRMERGSSFRIKRRASSGLWTEALVLWTGLEMKLLPSRKDRQRPRAVHRGMSARA